MKIILDKCCFEKSNKANIINYFIQHPGKDTRLLLLKSRGFKIKQEKN